MAIAAVNVLEWFMDIERHADNAKLAWLVPPLHMYRQLRGTYGVGKWGGIWRAAALSTFAFIAISLFVSLLVTLGAFD